MDTLEKAKILGEAGRYDSCGPKQCEVKVDNGLGGIYHAKAEHRTCRLFKTLMNNSCSFDCKYCPNASGSGNGGKKASYEPKELASLFWYLHKNLAVEGLFLSSAVAGEPDRVTEKMIEAVRLLRMEYNFHGYIHFKVLPGTSRELIRQASELSNRMSINVEAPNSDVLGELSSCKDYKTDILRRQSWISRLSLRSGQTTQVIVNGLSTDREILRMADWEYKAFGLKRMYYSAFRPVKGTPLENAAAESPLRQNRLYNADFLLREYGYKPKEIFSVMENGMLPRGDPKLELAMRAFDRPIDINQASYEELIRVPGIGPKTARKITETRNIRGFEDLMRLGGHLERAKPFIEINGKRQAVVKDFWKV